MRSVAYRATPPGLVDEDPLARRGARLAISDVTPDGLAVTEKLVTEAGAEVHSQLLNVAEVVRGASAPRVSLAETQQHRSEQAAGHLVIGDAFQIQAQVGTGFFR